MGEKTVHEIEIVGDTTKGVSAFGDLVRAENEAKKSAEQYGTALKGVSGELRDTRKNLRDATEAQRDAKNAVQAHKDAVELYGAESKQARVAAEQMRKAVEASSAEHKRAAAQVDELRRRLDAARKSTDTSEAAIRKYERQLEGATRQLKGAAEGQRRLDNVLTKSLGTLERNTAGILKWQKGLAAIEGAKAAFAAVERLADGIKSLTSGVAASGDEIAKTAKKYGIATDELQRLRFAADRSGASAEKFTLGFSNFSKRLEDGLGGRGTEGFADALDTLGVSLSSLQGLSRESQLGVIADSLKGIGDDSQRTALAMELFGRKAGPELVPLLMEGSAGIDALGDEAERLGLVMGKDALDSSEAFMDRMTDFKAVLSGLKNTIGSEMLPVLSDMLSEWTEWLVANREMLAQNIRGWLQGAGEVARLVFKAIKDLVAVVEGLVRTFGGMENALKVAAASWAALKLAVLAASGPIGLAAAGIAGVTAALVALDPAQKATTVLFNTMARATEEYNAKQRQLIEDAKKERDALADQNTQLSRQVELRRDIVRANENGADFVFGEAAGKRKRKELLRGRRFESLPEDEQKRIRIAEIDATLATPEDIDRNELRKALERGEKPKKGGRGKPKGEAVTGLYARRIDDNASIGATNEVVEARMASEAAEAIRQETAAREERIEMLELEGELRKAQIDASLGEEAAAERAREIDAEVASQKFQLEQELTDFKIEHAETRAEVIDLETERKKRAMREEIRAQQELQARERKILEQRTAAFMKMGGITGDVLGQVAVAAAESVGAEDDAFARSVQQMAKAIRNQMIMVSVKEAALAAAAAASSFGLSPEVEAHAIASAAAAAAAVVAGTVAGAIGAGLPAETGGSAGGGGGSPAPSASSGGGRGGGRSESQAPVSRATPTPAPSVSPSGATNVIHIHVGTLVGADEAAVEEIAKAIEKRLRRAV